MTTPTDNVAWPLMVMAQACLCAAWNDLPAFDPNGPAFTLSQPGMCTIVPGRDVAADNCCSGQAWVRLNQVTLSQWEQFPSPLTNQVDECPDMFWAVDMGVGVLRCAPQLSDTGQAPPATDLFASAAQIADDLGRVRKAMWCCLTAAIQADANAKKYEWKYSFGAEQMVGPEGGCVGFELQVVIGRQQCPC